MEPEGVEDGGLAALGDRAVEEEGLVADAATGVRRQDTADDGEQDQAAGDPEDVGVAEIVPDKQDQEGGNAQVEAANQEQVDERGETDPPHPVVVGAPFIKQIALAHPAAVRRGEGCQAFCPGPRAQAGAFRSRYPKRKLRMSWQPSVLRRR